jgi:hypothetical protein
MAAFGKEIVAMDAQKSPRTLLRCIGTISHCLMFLVTLLIVVLATPSYAERYQPPSYWANTYGGALAEEPSSVLQTTDGGFLAGGFTSSFGAGGKDMWIIKLSATGIIQWEKAYGGVGDDAVHSVKQTTDGGLYRCRYHCYRGFLCRNGGFLGA